jgi:predicted esterase YcpF (UPF0227 family)
MNKPTILYIHGFASGPGMKADLLRKAFPECDVISPTLTGDVAIDNKILGMVWNQYQLTQIEAQECPLFLVGTSLGGFYALGLAARAGFDKFPKIQTTYLINPSFEPHITLRKYLGVPIKNWKTGEPITLEEDSFKQLEHLYDYFTNSQQNLLKDSKLEVFIGEKDDVLTFDNFYKFIQDNGINANYTYEKQDHRFQDISSVIAKLSKEIIYF